MKNLLILFILIQFGVFGQNIGINSLNPQASLDIYGDIITSTGTINLTGNTPVGDVYSILDVNSAKHSSYKLTAGPSTFGSLTIVGIKAGSNGRIIHLINSTNNANILIYNDETNTTGTSTFNLSLPEERISTGLIPNAVAGPLPPGIGNLTLKPKGTVTLQYDSDIQKWVVRGSHMSSLSYLGDENWSKSGADIINTNSGNIIVNGSLRLADGTQGANKVLTSDANGLASWQANLNIKFGFDLLTPDPAPGLFPYGYYKYSLNYNTDPANVIATNATTINLAKAGVYRFGLLGMFFSGSIVNTGLTTSYSCKIVINAKEYKIIFNSPTTKEGGIDYFRQYNSLTFDAYVPENSDIQIYFNTNGGPTSPLTTTGYFFGYLVND